MHTVPEQDSSARLLAVRVRLARMSIDRDFDGRTATRSRNKAARGTFFLELSLLDAVAGVAGLGCQGAGSSILRVNAPALARSGLAWNLP